MPFMQHLDELRRRLAVVLGVVGLLALGMYFYSEPVYSLLIAPVKDIVGDSAVVLRVFDAMMIRFKVGVFAAVVIASPLIFWHVLAFFLPALRPTERKWVVPTFVSMVVLFLAGAAFCYTTVLGPGFQWLVDQAGDIFTYMPTGADLVTSILWFLLGFGIAFQTPVVVFYLVYFGLVPYKTLRQNWRVAWVMMVIVAAMATPDWSPVSMGILAVAMIVLYELSLLLVRVVLGKKIARQQAELEAI